MPKPCILKKAFVLILLVQALEATPLIAGDVASTVDFQYKNISYVHNFYDASLVNKDLGWIVGTHGSIFHTSDGGKTWKPQASGTTRELFGVSFVNPQKGWIVGRFGLVLGTVNGGESWEILQDEIEGQWSLFDTWFVDEVNGWAVGEFGTILHTTDGGQTWESQGLGEDKIYYSVCFAESQCGWIVGEFGIILRTTDGGATWSHQASPRGEASLLGVCCRDKDSACAVGVDGVIILTNDGGETWEELESPTKKSLFSVYTGEDIWWAVGKKGELIVCDYSRKWRRVRVPLQEVNSLNSIVFSDERHGIVIGDHGTVFVTSTGGDEWVKSGYDVGH